MPERAGVPVGGDVAGFGADAKGHGDLSYVVAESFRLGEGVDTGSHQATGPVELEFSGALDLETVAA